MSPEHLQHLQGILQIAAIVLGVVSVACMGAAAYLYRSWNIPDIRDDLSGKKRAEAIANMEEPGTGVISHRSRAVRAKRAQAKLAAENTDLMDLAASGSGSGSHDEAQVPSHSDEIPTSIFESGGDKTSMFDTTSDMTAMTSGEPVAGAAPTDDRLEAEAAGWDAQTIDGETDTLAFETETFETEAFETEAFADDGPRGAQTEASEGTQDLTVSLGDEPSFVVQTVSAPQMKPVRQPELDQHVYEEMEDLTTLLGDENPTNTSTILSEDAQTVAMGATFAAGNVPAVPARPDPTQAATTLVHQRTIPSYFTVVQKIVLTESDDFLQVERGEAHA